MKTRVAFFALLLSFTSLAGCGWNNTSNRDDHHPTPGEQAGQAAYNVQKDTKKAAKELARDLKTFGKDARQGFNEEKQKDQEHKDAHDSQPQK